MRATVGDLATHLARSVTVTPVYLAYEPTGEPVSAQQSPLR